MMRSDGIAVARHSMLLLWQFVGVKLTLIYIHQGWTAIRHENRTLTWLFFGVGMFLVVVWAAMFGSVIYRWTFQNSPFFATMTITAFLILVATLALAVVCRLNFGKGLMEFCKLDLHPLSTK